MFFKRQKSVVEGRSHGGMLQASDTRLGGSSYERQEGSPEADVGVTGYRNTVGAVRALTTLPACRQEQCMRAWKNALESSRMGNLYT